MLKSTYVLPVMPPPVELETPQVLRALARESRALAELKGEAKAIPNQGILIDTLFPQEAKASSEIGNNVTTQDELFQADMFPDGPTSAAAKEVALYRDALRLGFGDMQASGGIISNNAIIARFPKETDDYSLETWEEIALRRARLAGIATPEHQPVTVAGKPVLLLRRFDRAGAARIPFLSARAMLGARDGEPGSYPEIVDALSRQGSQARLDAAQLYRRVVFNVLVSNVDDHLRNHGFLWSGKAGWTLWPAYDLNPTPADLKAHILTTSFDLTEATCSLDLIQSSARFYGLMLAQARSIIKDVAAVTATWRQVARTVGARPSEISRMASAFEHEDQARAVVL